MQSLSIDMCVCVGIFLKVINVLCFVLPFICTTTFLLLLGVFPFIIAYSPAHVMPSAAENLEVVESTLRASLSQNKHLDQHVVSSTQRVLMHRVTFVPAAKPHTLQLRLDF